MLLCSREGKFKVRAIPFKWYRGGGAGKFKCNEGGAEQKYIRGEGASQRKIPKRVERFKQKIWN